ncbi:hypothetical protein RND71_010815 [Anisodus tanguticus]|uniref:CDP-diacylglycerol--glycerol-3-phosphate 1-phosphatidyltransferase n=1 Tax=Anisodus tanguticus TaxID=243964 RepID=A0AAE1SJZ9_9SOLA|nr:hypothetical protein RND71_010815 [Anisodus tanguticus]
MIASATIAGGLLMCYFSIIRCEIHYSSSATLESQIYATHRSLRFATPVSSSATPTSLSHYFSVSDSIVAAVISFQLSPLSSPSHLKSGCIYFVFLRSCCRRRHLILRLKAEYRLFMEVCIRLALKLLNLLTLPTILTIGCVAAIPIIVTTFYVDSWWGPTATTGIFIAAAITDWLDGYLARKMNLGTAFGAFLDPVADKLMVAATLILLCTRPLEASMFGQLPWILTVPSIAIIGREITMSAVREWAASQGGKLSEAVAVNNLGKWKTATQMTALTILLLTRDSSLSGAGTVVASGVILLYVSAWLAVWSVVICKQIHACARGNRLLEAFALTS